MEDLTPIEQSIVEALKGLGATKDSSIKSVEDITKKCSRPKGLVTNSLIALTQKGVIKRVAKDKTAGYYLVDTK
jgi:predicted transcriptional regulator